jgi:hypothetical protein
MPKKYETICVDFDKTLCLDDKFGKPNTKLIKQIEELYLDGFFIIVYTSRRQCDEHKIEKWLMKHKASYDLILTGKPEAVVYIDDRAVQPNTFFLKQHIKYQSNKLKGLVENEQD